MIASEAHDLSLMLVCYRLGPSHVGRQVVCQVVVLRMGAVRMMVFQMVAVRVVVAISSEARDLSLMLVRSLNSGCQSLHLAINPNP
jgi:hypothetical protein